MSSAPLRAQHTHGSDAHAGHGGKPVDCTTLASPPWSGLPAADRSRIRELERSVRALGATSEAERAGFRPAFGDIPTMGVHWINGPRMRDDVSIMKPDHLLFSRIGGRDSLVGIAYAFQGATDAKIPRTFDSDLAQWHDHPELGGAPGQTLHMLHVWFVPSAYGPFAGNNFFLPLMSAGQALPSGCWLDSDAAIDRFEKVATLVDMTRRNNDSASIAQLSELRRMFAMGGGRGMAALAALTARTAAPVAALDSAARRGDRAAWERAADSALNALLPIEQRFVTLVRDRLKGAQTSSMARPPGR
jgi:hypothetical protein